MLFKTNVLAALALPLLAQAADYGTCTAGGQHGQCISTSSCSGGGGKSTAGLCPGDASIQCCTYGACTKSGTKGTCEPTSTCSGTSTAGLCPGPSNIQCCTAASSGGGSGGGSSGACPPDLNTASINLIKSFEGFRASPYNDPTGHQTVGYGHLCTKSGCTETGYSYPMSEAQGTALLQKDVKSYESCLNNAVKVKLNPNQYGALVSWTYNEGCGGMQGSQLISRLNAGEDPNTVAAQELPKWNKSSGQTLPGLTRRRAAEVDLFKTAASGVAIHC